MRRVRQTSPGLSPAIFSRLSAAIALSAAFHIVLIYGFSLAPGSIPGPRIAVIHARLMAAQPSRSPQPAKPVVRIGAPEPGPAPSVLSQPVATPSIPPATEPPTTISPVDSPDTAPPAISDATGASVPDTVHYPASELDIYPQAYTRIAPDYPEAARDAHVAGSVTLLVLIDDVGKVVDTSVMDAVPDGVFEQTAQAALANASFYPAQKDGRPVRSRILIKVEFDPESTGTAQ